MELELVEEGSLIITIQKIVAISLYEISYRLTRRSSQPSHVNIIGNKYHISETL